MVSRPAGMSRRSSDITVSLVQVRCDRSQRYGVAACTRGISPSSEPKRGLTEIGSAQVLLLPDDTTVRRFSSDHAVPLS